MLRCTSSRGTIGLNHTKDYARLGLGRGEPTLQGQPVIDAADISLYSTTVHDRWSWTIVPLEVSIIFSTGSYHQHHELCINIMKRHVYNALQSGAWTLVASAVTWVTCVDRELPHSTCSLVSIVIQANTHIATIPVLSRTTSHIQAVPLETRQRKASVGSSLVLSIPLFLRVASSLAASV